eukprot:3998689-Ditylum_brightwellii.AAC.1
MYSLTVKYYEAGTPEDWFQFINAISQNEEANQEDRDGPACMKCLAAVTKHVFLKKAYKIQKNKFRTSMNP